MSYIDTLRENVESLGIAEKVKWLGHKTSPEIAQEFERAAALVLPSYMETSPNAVSEAMCAGVPVIATNVGGIPDIITHGKTGLLVESRNIDQLALAINLILDDGEVASRLAGSAKQQAAMRFAGRVAAEKTMVAYNKIITLTKSSECSLDENLRRSNRT